MIRLHRVSLIDAKMSCWEERSWRTHLRASLLAKSLMWPIWILRYLKLHRVMSLRVSRSRKKYATHLVRQSVLLVWLRKCSSSSMLVCQRLHIGNRWWYCVCVRCMYDVLCALNAIARDSMFMLVTYVVGIFSVNHCWHEELFGILVGVNVIIIVYIYF